MRTRRSLLICLLVAALVPFASGPVAQARVGNWVSGDQRYFIIDQICRDGMRYRALDTSASPTPGTTSSIDLGARLYTAPGVFDIVNTQDYNAPQRYGELLSPVTDYPLTYHDTPVADPPSPGDTYYIYGSGTILWPRLLTAGTDRVVVVHKQNAWQWDTVQDCQLNPTTVIEGGSITLGHANLPFDTRLAPADALRYTLTSLPSGGLLTLDGAALAVGAQFTQAMIDGGRLRYIHSGGEAASDSFGYSVRAITRVSVATDGTQANAAATNPSISADASAVAFTSAASNLVAGDSNGVADIFVRRTSMRQTERGLGHGQRRPGQRRVGRPGDRLRWQRGGL